MGGAYLALGIPGASVAAATNLMKENAVNLVNDRNGNAPGDCTALAREVGTNFDRADTAVACA